MKFVGSSLQDACRRQHQDHYSTMELFLSFSFLSFGGLTGEKGTLL